MRALQAKVVCGQVGVIGNPMNNIALENRSHAQTVQQSMDPRGPQHRVMLFSLVPSKS